MQFILSPIQFFDRRIADPMAKRIVSRVTDPIVRKVWRDAHLEMQKFAQVVTAHITTRAIFLITATTLFTVSISVSPFLATVSAVLGLYAVVKLFILIKDAMGAYLHCNQIDFVTAFNAGIKEGGCCCQGGSHEEIRIRALNLPAPLDIYFSATQLLREEDIFKNILKPLSSNEKILFKRKIDLQLLLILEMATKNLRTNPATKDLDSYTKVFNFYLPDFYSTLSIETQNKIKENDKPILEKLLFSILNEAMEKARTTSNNPSTALIYQNKQVSFVSYWTIQENYLRRGSELPKPFDIYPAAKSTLLANAKIQAAFSSLNRQSKQLWEENLAWHLIQILEQLSEDFTNRSENNRAPIIAPHLSKNLFHDIPEQIQQIITTHCTEEDLRECLSSTIHTLLNRTSTSSNIC